MLYNLKSIFLTYVLFFFGSLNILNAQTNGVDSLKQLLKTTKNDSIKCILMLQLASSSSDNKKADYLHQLKIFSKKSAEANTYQKSFFNEMLVEAMSSEGLEALNRADYSNNTYNSFSTSLAIAIENKNYMQVAMSYSNLGYYFYLKGDILQGINNYQKSLVIIDKYKIVEGKSYVLNNLASVYHENGDFDLALKYYKECLLHDSINGMENMSYTVFNNIGVLYNQKKNAKEAKVNLEKAISLAAEAKDYKEIVAATNNLGVMYSNVPDYKTALEHYAAALRIALKYNLRVGQGISHSRMSEAYRNTGDFRNAIVSGEKALKVGREIKSSDLISRAAHQLILVYKNTEDFKKAFEMKELFQLHHDSLENDKNQKAILNSQYRYEYEKKAIADSLRIADEKILNQLQIEKEKTQNVFLYLISALALIFSIIIYDRFRKTKAQNKEIESKNEFIQKSLTEKEVLLKEIHHRVKNNLQVISSLLGLQSSKINDERLKQIFNESKNKISTIGLIHQKLYQNNDLSEIDLQDYFQSLFKAIASVFEGQANRITFEISTNSIKFDIDTAVPLGLIFNELVTNSMKYAFSDSANGIVKVDLSMETSGKFKLVIEDNGKGYNTEDQSNGSLGLNLVNMLTMQLNGSFKIEHNKGIKNILIFENTTKRKEQD